MYRRQDARVPGMRRGLVASAVAGSAFIAGAGAAYERVFAMRDLVLMGTIGAVGFVLLGIAMHGLFAAIQRKLARARRPGVAFRA